MNIKNPYYLVKELMEYPHYFYIGLGFVWGNKTHSMIYIRYDNMSKKLGFLRHYE